MDAYCLMKLSHQIISMNTIKIGRKLKTILQEYKLLSQLKTVLLDKNYSPIYS